MGLSLRSVVLAPHRHGVDFRLSAEGWSFPAGRIQFLVGENGAGKSILARLLVGDSMPGTNGPHWEGNGRHEPRVALVRQSPQDNIALDLFARENLLVRLRVRSPRDIVFPERVYDERNIDSEFEGRLKGKSKRPTMSFSGGESQLLALKAALLEDVDLLILDEFTASLDRETRSDMWQEVRKYANDGISVLAMSHSAAEVKAHAHTTFGIRLDNNGSDRWVVQLEPKEAADFLADR